jgi:DNA repair protein RadC
MMHTTDVRGLFGPIVGEVAGTSMGARYSTLGEVARATDAELLALPGMGPRSVRAVRAVWAIRDGIREEAVAEAPLLDNPGAVADLLRDGEDVRETERMQVLMVTVRRRLIRVHTVADGLLDQILVHAREVFRPAITANAHAIILAHNHPSGDPTPSEPDIRVTRELIRAGRLLKIEVLDHVILGRRSAGCPSGYVSMMQLGLLPAT